MRSQWETILWSTCFVLGFGCFVSMARPDPAHAWSWVPSEEEIQKYRESWNPFSHGPILVSSADLQPKGQFYLRPFIFSQVGEHSFGNRFALSSERQDGPIHLYSVQDPFVQMGYGVTNHIQFLVATSLNSFWVKDTASFNRGQGGPWKTNTGLGDSSLVVFYRPIVQDPDTWRPSVTSFTGVGLPTGRWFTGTKTPPGRFAPLGRLPSTQFGSLALTEGVETRKNFRPFRISANAYYTYEPPGSEGLETTYVPDVINTRIAFEHILSDNKGLGYTLEFVSIHGVPWRLDGHVLNRGQQHGFSVLGIEPAIQWRFGDSNIVGSVGVLFTVAGQNAMEAIYPNFSIFWYWSKSGQVLMR